MCMKLDGKTHGVGMVLFNAHRGEGAQRGLVRAAGSTKVRGYSCSGGLVVRVHKTQQREAP